MARQASVLALAVLAAVGDAAVIRGNSFLGNAMRPDVVADTLVNVEDEWRKQAAVFAQGNSTAAKDAPGAFSKSCATVVSAIVQGSGGDRDVAKEYMNDVCNQKVMEGWHKLRCTSLGSAITDHAMKADEYANRNNLNPKKVCSGFWSVFVETEKNREAEEAKLRAEQEAKDAKVKAEQEKVRAELEKKAEIAAAEAKKKADAQAKIEAELKAKEEENRIKKQNEEKAKRDAEEAKKRAAEAAARLAEKKAEAEKIAKEAQQKLEEAAKAEKEHQARLEEHKKAEETLRSTAKKAPADSTAKVAVAKSSNATVAKTAATEKTAAAPEKKADAAAKPVVAAKVEKKENAKAKAAFLQNEQTEKACLSEDVQHRMQLQNKLAGFCEDMCKEVGAYPKCQCPNFVEPDATPGVMTWPELLEHMDNLGEWGSGLLKEWTATAR